MKKQDVTQITIVLCVLMLMLLVAFMSKEDSLHFFAGCLQDTVIALLINRNR